MIEFEDVPDLVEPTLVCAFEGWNDAAGAATGVIDHLLEVWSARLIGAIDPDDFYDFQVNRPMVSTDDAGMRSIVWPSTQLYVARPPDAHRDVVLVRGIEPNMRWRQFCAELLAAADDLGVGLVCTLGAMLAEIPHTRPIQVSGSATELDLEDRLKLERSSYEGPTGIVGVVQDACVRLDLPSVSFWAAVPHYLPQPPCPKATLALIGQVEDLLQVNVPLGDLPEDSRAWERGVAELTEEDEDIAEYVRSLEQAADAADLPEASGEAIAREFERYLKRRERGPGSSDR
ncbi:PAC2 family protein [Nocardioides terrisoli]|uniref:PAC2 family protein n=1 Tax=Nocardioides terrisoli TaxID=3388267 RepID=UPI00287B786D|nr:PAC2 family protein [Nocardioides marmorisolisilvae]